MKKKNVLFYIADPKWVYIIQTKKVSKKLKKVVDR